MLPSPAPDFSDPLGLLAACHGRMREQAALLERLHGHLEEHGADTPARQAAERVLRYFDTAAPLHHRDEEDDLLPLLGGRLPEPVARRLREDHRRLEAAWSTLRLWLDAIATGRRPADAGAVRAFVPLLRAHVDFEDAELLPRARAHLDDDALRRLGRAMAARRRG